MAVATLPSIVGATASAELPASAVMLEDGTGAGVLGSLANSGWASALGPLLRLRSASNGEGRVNGDAAGVRDDCDSNSLVARDVALGRAAGEAAGRDVPTPARNDDPDPPVFPASPLSNSSSGNNRWACTSFSRPNSRWKRCSCL